MITQTREQKEARLQKLESDIDKVHIPKLRPFVTSFLSLILPISPFGFHGIWKAVSPETYLPEAENFNHAFADTLFIGYNALKACRGEFRGFAQKWDDYVRSEEEFQKLDYQLNWSIFRDEPVEERVAVVGDVPRKEGLIY